MKESYIKFIRKFIPDEVLNNGADSTADEVSELTCKENVKKCVSDGISKITHTSVYKAGVHYTHLGVKAISLAMDIASEKVGRYERKLND